MELDNMINIKPIGNKVAARIVQEQTKAGSLLLISPQESRHIRAIVIAYGESVKTVKCGDTILVQKYGYQEIKLNENEFIMIKCDDILATLTEE